MKKITIVLRVLAFVCCSIALLYVPLLKANPLSDLLYRTCANLQNISDCYNSQTHTLDLHGQSISNLPEDFFYELAKIDSLLIVLNLSDNKLTSLSESIIRLHNLERLYLRDNKLTNLPVSIGNLAKLEFLYVQRNQLKKIPKSVVNLKNLRELSVRDNQLMSLPKRLYKLPRLQKLYLGEYINLLSAKAKKKLENAAVLQIEAAT